MLYYIVSLHQTTTIYRAHEVAERLYYIVSLHQTTTVSYCSISCCWVVLYRFSTSNHNDDVTILHLGRVVLYRFSTSNHNLYHLHY